MIKLKRRYFKDCTLGTLTLPSGKEFAIMERPSLDNAPNVSCIPEGTYTLKKRLSPAVERTSRGEFKEGWEVKDVANRSFIMFHVGNYARNSEGCLLVGKDFSYNNDFMVTNSIIAFREFMAEMDKRDTWQLEITAAGYHDGR